MDIDNRVIASNVMDSLPENPIGIYALDILKEQYTIFNNSNNKTYDFIYNQLQNNNYLTFSEWYHDITQLFYNNAKFIGITTRVGCVFMTCLQIIDEIIEESKKNPKKPIKFELKKIQDLITELIKEAPNNLNDLEVSITNLKSKPILKENKFNLDLDLPSLPLLYEKIQCINSEIALKDIFQTISLYEKGTNQSKGIISFDLNKLSPFTLILLKKKLMNYILI